MPDVAIDPRRRRHDPLHVGHHGPAEGRGVDAPRGARRRSWASAARPPSRGAAPAGDAEPPKRYPHELHPHRAAVPRHRLRAGDALVLRGGLKLVIMYKWDAGARARADRARAGHQLRRRADAVLGPARVARLRASATRRASQSVGGGGAPAPPELVRRVDVELPQRRARHRLRHDRDQRLRPAERRRRLPAPARRAPGRAVPDPRDRGPRPGRDRRCRPASVGEIWFKGPNLIRGYWNRPDATAETIVDGWLRSGDLGRIDDEGFVYVEDRAKDMVLRARRERVLRRGRGGDLRAPRRVRGGGVRRAPRAARRGGRACRLPEAGHGARRSTRCSARAASGSRRSRCRRVVEFAREPLPRNAAGKILKRELRDALAAARS